MLIFILVFSWAKAPCTSHSSKNTFCWLSEKAPVSGLWSHFTSQEWLIMSLHFDLCSMQDSGGSQMPAEVTAVPFSLEDLDRTIAAFDTVEQLLRSLSPDTWRQDLDSIYTQTHMHYRSRAYHLASRHNKGKCFHKPYINRSEKLYNPVKHNCLFHYFLFPLLMTKQSWHNAHIYFLSFWNPSFLLAKKLISDKLMSANWM